LFLEDPKVASLKAITEWDSFHWLT
jgi:hypothetical protein